MMKTPHQDHSLLTGLCSAIYLFHPLSEQAAPSTPLKAVPAPHPDSGLYIIPRGSTKPTKVSIPPNCLAFQTGEALQLCTGQSSLLLAPRSLFGDSRLIDVLVSGGKLRATPHFVRAGSAPDGKAAVTIDGVKGLVTRETFAFFLQVRSRTSALPDLL